MPFSKVFLSILHLQTPSYITIKLVGGFQILYDIFFFLYFFYKQAASENKEMVRNINYFIELKNLLLTFTLIDLFLDIHLGIKSHSKSY